MGTRTCVAGLSRQTCYVLDHHASCLLRQQFNAPHSERHFSSTLQLFSAHCCSLLLICALCTVFCTLCSCFCTLLQLFVAHYFMPGWHGGICADSVVCWLMQEVVHLGAKQKMGINTCRELFSLTGGVCRFASHLVSWPKLLFNQVSPPPTLGKGVRECKQWYPSSTRYPGLCRTTESRTTRELGEYWPTPFSNMIEEVSEVNSRKGGSLTPGRSQKPCVAGPGCGREGGLSYTEARETNLSYACGRTKDGRTC